eukprot:CAMPEP_0202482506 /NCGR_PEP_ID=MMETSP1361-20130828/1902_1 /ASSEMBLY_ACC=CAM_ASM_000849 /TAXON_ID=210615 /ORGANISM="Staurosira complex sp., Strain CCMP2646" /LENGTH=85 /DNA_ID=CAMNT_0049110405 /DNA_START=724 /DNA_END=982 /DNA_ORIENTATION=+
MTEDSDEVNGFEIDAGGGLKQMLLPKKLDEESEEGIKMFLLTNEWATWKYFVDLLKEQLDMTGLCHDEISARIKRAEPRKSGYSD